MSQKKSLEDIESMLAAEVAKKTGIAPAEIDRTRRFDHYGLDSTDAVVLVGDLEDFVGRPLSATLPYRYPTIARLAQRLAEGASD
jgi:acyl carrier protein